MTFKPERTKATGRCQVESGGWTDSDIEARAPEFRSPTTSRQPCPGLTAHIIDLAVALRLTLLNF